LLLVFSGVFGSIAEQAEELLSTSEELAALIAGMGEGAIVDLFFAFYMGLLAVVAAGFTVQSLLRARNEEVAGGAEPILATGVSRTRWFASHIAIAAGGSARSSWSPPSPAALAHLAMTGDAGPIGSCSRRRSSTCRPSSPSAGSSSPSSAWFPAGRCPSAGRAGRVARHRASSASCSSCPRRC
jgi:ABC-2 type transport system permease protein